MVHTVVVVRLAMTLVQLYNIATVRHGISSTASSIVQFKLTDAFTHSWAFRIAANGEYAILQLGKIDWRNAFRCLALLANFAKGNLGGSHGCNSFELNLLEMASLKLEASRAST